MSRCYVAESNNDPAACMDCRYCRRQQYDTTKCLSCGEEIKLTEAINGKCSNCHEYELEWGISD